VLERGGVIGGSSAGATIQGDYLVRGAIAGSEIVMTPEPEHEHGFAFLRKVAIDQHINTRNRWDDIIPVIKKYPNLLGIGLSEGTAIVVTGDRFQVISSRNLTGMVSCLESGDEDGPLTVPTSQGEHSL
jgi:cyanophycinase